MTTASRSGSRGGVGAGGAAEILRQHLGRLVAELAQHVPWPGRDPQGEAVRVVPARLQAADRGHQPTDHRQAAGAEALRRRLAALAGTHGPSASWAGVACKPADGDVGCRRRSVAAGLSRCLGPRRAQGRICYGIRRGRPACGGRGRACCQVPPAAVVWAMVTASRACPAWCASSAFRWLASCWTRVTGRRPDSRAAIVPPDLPALGRGESVPGAGV